MEETESNKGEWTSQVLLGKQRKTNVQRTSTEAQTAFSTRDVGK